MRGSGDQPTAPSEFTAASGVSWSNTLRIAEWNLPGLYWYSQSGTLESASHVAEPITGEVTAIVIRARMLQEPIP